ncbi:MAG: RnfABCDGE type electron transport complex subunit B [Betaproteobacteria bacterium]
MNDIADRIDALLPQTQCTKCGYAGCRPYATAIAVGEADIDQCPPGGADGIRALAVLLGREPKPLNPANGVETGPTAALIDERWCIGCTLCIQACPVDAIVGAAKTMHTVLLEHCTGCELCIPPCPVDCIDLVPLQALNARGALLAIGGPSPASSRARYAFHQQRLASRPDSPSDASAMDAKVERSSTSAQSPDVLRRRAAVQAAIERARTRRDTTSIKRSAR